MFVARYGQVRLCGSACVLARRARLRPPAEVEAERARLIRAGWSPERVEAERVKAAAALRAAGYTQAKRERDHLRRARRAGATVEVFSHLEVFERDGWVCGICDQEVDRELAYPDPASVSLDHVVPLSLGGEHSRANTRPAHLRCNVLRGNRAA